MKLFDLTHTFDDSMPVYPGDPASKISFLNEHSRRRLFRLAGNDRNAHGNAYRRPASRDGGGMPLSEMPVESYIGRGVLIDARGKKSIDADLLADVPLREKGYSARTDRMLRHVSGSPLITGFPVSHSEVCRSPCNGWSEHARAGHPRS